MLLISSPQKGHSFSEYAIILAVVAVVTIPAVHYLGNITTQGYDTVKANDLNQLTSLLDVKNPKYLNGSTYNNPNTQSNGSYSSVLTNFSNNAGGGFNWTFGGGKIPTSGTEVNSGQGKLTQQLASSLSALLAMVDEVDQLPDDVQANLNKLANAGQFLADAEDAFENAPDAEKKQKATSSQTQTKNKSCGYLFGCTTTSIQKSALVTTPESKVRTDVLTTYEDFVIQRKLTMELLASLPAGPAKDTVQQLVDKYSQAITTIADQSYFSDPNYQIGSTLNATTTITHKKGCIFCQRKKTKKKGANIPFSKQAQLLADGGGIPTDSTMLPLFPPITREYSKKIRNSRKDAQKLWKDKAKADKQITQAKNEIKALKAYQIQAQTKINKANQVLSDPKKSGDKKALTKAKQDLKKANTAYTDAKQGQTDAQADLIYAQKESKKLASQAASIDAETQRIEKIAITEAQKQQAKLKENAASTGFSEAG